jgi:hypothetical protein
LKLEFTLLPQVAPIGKASRFDVVLDEKPPDDALVNARAAALNDGMLATPEDLSGQVFHVLILRLEPVGRIERTCSFGGNEEVSSRL